MPADLPLNARVTRLSRTEDGFEACTEHVVFRARQVVVATGPFQVPFVSPAAVPTSLPSDLCEPSGSIPPALDKEPARRVPRRIIDAFRPSTAGHHPGASIQPWEPRVAGSAAIRASPAPGAFHPFWNDTRTGQLEIFTATVRERLGYTSRRRISQLAAASSSAVHRQSTPKPCHGESRSLAS
jgi:hypothetical protein